jgi:hypothetical protein
VWIEGQRRWSRVATALILGRVSRSAIGISASDKMDLITETRTDVLLKYLGWRMWVQRKVQRKQSTLLVPPILPCKPLGKGRLEVWLFSLKAAKE